jgi:hypothetical protein
VCDPLAVGLSFADQRRETLAQVSGRLLVEAVIDLAGIHQVAALAAADVYAIPIVAVEREARDRERLSLRAGLLHPVVAAAGNVSAIAHLGDDTLEPDFAGVGKTSRRRQSQSCR